MQIVTDKAELLLPINLFSEQISIEPESKTGRMSRRVISPGSPAVHCTRKMLFFWTMGLAFLLGLAPLSSAMAQSPFSINGIVPDEISGLFTVEDPSGSVQELGAANGSSTKLGTVHTASPPMLGFTNPNGQTDLVNIWLATEVDALDDIWVVQLGNGLCLAKELLHK